MNGARALIVFAVAMALLTSLPMSSQDVDAARLITTFEDGDAAKIVEFTTDPLPGERATFYIKIKADVTVTQAVMNASAVLLERNLQATGGGLTLLGYGIDNSGDFNGDGYTDLIVTAPGTTGTNTAEGFIAGVRGSASGLAFPPAFQIRGPAANAFLGWGLCMGDLNEDGYDDMITSRIEMDFTTSTGTGTGDVLIHWGASTINTTPDRVISYGANGDMFGYSVSANGDVNGDGHIDLVVGSPRNEANTNNPGRVFIYYGTGTTSLPSSPNVTLTGADNGDGFGRVVHICGDVNDDGYDDVFVGAPGHNGTSDFDMGRAYIFYGGASGVDTTADWNYTGKNEEDFLGYSGTGLEDANNDGIDDLAIGVPLWDDSGATDAGEVLVFYGGSGGPSTSPDVTIKGDIANGVLGIDVACGGDINNDGLGDLVVGCPNSDNGSLTDAGHIQVHFGNVNGLSSTPEKILRGWVADADDGYSVGPGGDIDGDGYDDISAGDMTGSVTYTYYGGPGAPDPAIYLDNTEIWSHTGSFLSNKRTDDFTDELNTYIATHQGDVDENGYLKVPINVSMSHVGLVKLDEIFIQFFKLVQPTSLVATPTPVGNAIRLTWDDHTIKMDDISKMAIEMWNGTGWEEVTKVAKNAKDYTVTDLEDGTLYTFRLRAFDGAVQQYSEPSDPASATPADTKAPGKVMTLLAKEDRDLMGINVSWDPSDSDVVNYQLWSNKTGAWEVLTNVSAPLTHYIDTDVDDGPRYYYRVRAWDEVPLVGEFSNIVWGVLQDMEPPVVPENLRISEPPAGRSLLIMWDLNTDDTREYSLESNKSGSWREIALVGKTINAYTDTNLIDGTRYYYRLQARDESGNPSEYSNIVSAVPIDATPPAAPGGLEATPRPVGNMMRLTWILNTDDTVGYNIYMWDDPTSQWKVVVSVTGQVSTYDVPGLLNGETYRFRLKAVDLAEWESEWSNEATGVPVDTSPPMIPTGVEAENDPNGRAVNITWSANNDDTVEYIILRWDGSSWVELGRVDHPQSWFYIDGLENNQPYTYVIRAVDEADNESPNSARLDVIPTDTIKPDPPVFIDLPTITNQRDLVIKGKSEYGASVRVFLNLYPQDPVPCAADGTFQLTVRLKSGPNEVSAVAEDDAGASDSSPRYTIVVDTTGPKVSSTQPPSGTRSMPRTNLTFDVYFSEEVRSGSIKCILRKGVLEASVMLQSLDDPSNIEATLKEYNRVRSLASFEVEAQLESGTTYTFLIYSVEDIAGNPMDTPSGAYAFTLETTTSGGGGGGGTTSEGLGSLAMYLVAAIVIVLVIIIAVVLVSRSGTKEEVVVDREILAAPREEPSAEDLRPDISSLYADAYQERGDVDTEHHQVEAGLGDWLAEQERASQQADEETKRLVEEMAKQAPPAEDDHVIEEVPPDVFSGTQAAMEGEEGEAGEPDAEAPEEEGDQEEAAALLDELDEELGEDASEDEEKEG